MADEFEKIEELNEETTKKRRELDQKGSIRPEKIDKAGFYSDKKRDDYITDNREETPNVETDPNQ